MKRLFTIALAAFSSIAFGTTLSPIQLLNPAGSTAGQAIVSTGASSAPHWSNVTASGLVAQAANTVVANTTNAAASPTAFAMPSCSASGNVIQYVSGTGFTCATGYALLSSPTFTGVPAAPTPAANTNTTQIATTAFVEGEFASPPAAGFGSTTRRPVSATTVSASGAITPSSTAGIVGTTLGDNASAGSVGEYVLTTGASGVALTNGAYSNLASVTLAPGDWDLEGICSLTASSSTTAMICGLNTVSNTNPGGAQQAGVTYGSAVLGSSTIATPVVRFNVSTPTTVYVGGQSNFSSGTVTGQGWIRQRRVR
ncbi:TPA: hypothetical protein QDC51_001485 [Burkholderia multivorans]|nr:hypothetical protein [Burkholderia multivorans]HDR9840843.1 hypothetical protein [Burkholderia multivorans]HDR9847365.1 hypothetical protein [Burkholderia multivorans]HDR9853779.1 hypothetical protein [Burkholderia multivorans]